MKRKQYYYVQECKESSNDANLKFFRFSKNPVRCHDLC